MDAREHVVRLMDELDAERPVIGEMATILEEDHEMHGAASVLKTIWRERARMSVRLEDILDDLSNQAKEAEWAREAAEVLPGPESLGDKIREASTKLTQTAREYQ